MARINTNVPSMVGQFNLARNNVDLERTLTRLSTGLRINRGADDPAGLIISERIRTDIAGVEQAIRNGDRASSVIATTESGLNEVTELLNSIKALMVESANTGANSKAERDANQLQIDSAIQSITRISNTATFGGLKLLDGNLDYVTSGITTGEIAKTEVFGASFIGTERLQVEVDVLASAQKGMLFMQGGVSPIDAAGALESAVTIQVGGSRGVQEFSVASGASLTDLVDSINQRTQLTGVTARLVNNNAASGIVFETELYGSNSFLSVERVDIPSTGVELQTYKLAEGEPQVSGTPYPWASLISGGQLVTGTRDIGQDVQALINGSLASGDGLNISINSTLLSVGLQLTETFGTDPTATNSTFDITGGGSLFQLGPEINAVQQANIGVRSVAASKLGGVLVDGGLQYLSSVAKGGSNDIETSIASGDFSTASDIIDAAIDEVTILRGRLGAFERNVLDTNRRSLQAAQENLTASRSVIVDADFAFETSELTRAQILQQSGTTVLTLANQNAQSVLQLLG